MKIPDGQATNWLGGTIVGAFLLSFLLWGIDYSAVFGGFIPLRATGGLVDTVQNFVEGQAQGTGFVFDAATAGALADTIGWACATYYDRSRELAGLQQRAMAQDFSWRQSAAQYVELYGWAIAARMGSAK